MFIFLSEKGAHEVKYIDDEGFKVFVDNPFVLIVGPPRCGTSLACDMVRACGYSFGITLQK